MDHASVVKLIGSISGRTLLVVGDFMLDRTIYGEASRISPEAPTPVVRVHETRTQLGGAGNVARNVASLGGRVYCAAVLGGDRDGAVLETELRAIAADSAAFVVREPERTTTVKTRIVAIQGGRRSEQPHGHQQIVRLDEESRHSVSPETADAVLRFCSSVIGRVDGVIVSDYAKGAVSPELAQSLIRIARSAGKPVFVDPKAKDFSRYSGATVLTPNAAEAQMALDVPFAAFETSSEGGLGKIVQSHLREIGLDALLVTRGAEGVSLIDGEGFHHFPTSAREVFDVTGAGDTLIAAFALAASAGASLPEAAQFGNLAAGVAVSKAGAAAVYPFEVERELDLRHLSAESKIRAREQITQMMENVRREAKKIVFTNGCFDLLHVGHMQLLREAKRLGDVLVVGLNTDASVRRLKGTGRPIVAEEDRAYAVAALESVDYLVLFDEPDPMELIRAIRPDVLVKGDDYKESEVVGNEFVRSYGGVTRLVPLRRGISTSALVEKIRSAQST
jgi:D-beta-D-heptose 7-phosphate kinase / D-beta-D-heptose 1-phosphate adenosyltransferase